MCQLCAGLGYNIHFGADAADVSSNVVTSAAKPVATIAQLGDYLVNGFWQDNDTIAHHFGSSTITYNISGLNANEQMLAQSALNAWQEVANLTFVQTSGAANITFTHNGTMTAWASSNYSGSGIISSATVNISADWITNGGGAYDGKTGIDSYGYQTYLHEIGHALGLGHQGSYNGSGSYSTSALYANDTWQYSLMSYFAQNNYGGSYRYVVTPQMADIYAIQAIYGAATTRTGDTVYGFNNTAGSIFSFASYSQAPALTIYDSGGNDTLDCSGYSAAQTIDLRAGAFCSVGGLTNNIGIALNTIVENAIGGGGNDQLIANDLGCTLVGGGGNDRLLGAAGNDRLVGGIGVDVMMGGAGNDTYFVDNFGDAVIENANEGIDTIIANFNYLLAVNLEQLFLEEAAGAATGVGNSGQNLLVGNSFDNALDGGSGNDTLMGGAGNDTLFGGTGADGMIGGTGNDTYFVDTVFDVIVEYAGEGIDTVYTNSNYIIGANVEQLYLQESAGAATGVGNDGQNLLVGNSFDNALDGGSGNDTLKGGDGNDTLFGGTGIDGLYGEGGNDNFLFRPSTAAGDVIVDFAGNGAAAGDQLYFQGFGTGATFTQQDAIHWVLTYNAGTNTEVITFQNAAAIHASDFYFL